jgi:predicted PurR-regulated permease PerM
MSGTGDTDREFIARSVRWGIILLVVAAACFMLLWVLKAALTPLVAAFALAYLLDPLIDRFEERKIPRGVAIFVLLAVFGSALVVAAFFLVPKLTQEILEFRGRLPGYLDGALGVVGTRLNSWFGISVPGSVREGLDALQSAMGSVPLDTLRRLVAGVVESVTGTLGSLIGCLVIPVIAYYALVEFDRVRAWMLTLVPERYQDAVGDKASTINTLISGFIRGQLIVCALLGVLYAIGFSIIGIEMAVGIGLVAGVLAIIPYVGGAVALILAAGMCILQYGIDLHLAFVVGWYAMVQTLEGAVLTPQFVGRSVGLHPVAVIVGLLIGGDLLGFLGMLVAIPLTAVAQVFVKDLLNEYWNSPLYSGSPPGSAE